MPQTEARNHRDPLEALFPFQIQAPNPKRNTVIIAQLMRVTVNQGNKEILLAKCRENVNMMFKQRGSREREKCILGYIEFFPGPFVPACTHDRREERGESIFGTK